MTKILPGEWVALLAAGALASCGGRQEMRNDPREEPKATPTAGQPAAGTNGREGPVVAGSGGRHAAGSTGGSATGGSVAGGSAAGDGGGAGVQGGAGEASGPVIGGPLSLAAPVAYRGGAWAMDLAVADLDGDGALDVASADFRHPDAGAYVWLNHGDGTFAEAAPYFPGKHATSIAVGDFDGDTAPDLVLATENDGLSLLTNHGDGTFSAPLELGVTGTYVRVLDANGDEKLDLWADSSLYLNQGGGAFGAAMQVEPGSPRLAVDLNDDGKTDLVAGGGRVFVTLNGGGGTFHPRAEYGTGATAMGSVVRGSAVADIDGDGTLDIAAANDQERSVSVLFNDGGGSFAGLQVYEAGAWPTSVALGDLNGDGAPELVVANSGVNSASFGSTWLGVYRNRGDGKLETPEEFLHVEFGYVVALADLDGDARLDIVVGDAGGRLKVILNAAP